MHARHTLRIRTPNIPRTVCSFYSTHFYSTHTTSMFAVYVHVHVLQHYEA